MTLLSSTASWANEEHRMFAESASKFLEIELRPNVEKWAEEGLVERSFWEKAGEMGLMGGSVDETFGGSGGDISYDAITAYLQAAKGDAGWGYGIQSIVIHYLNSYGSNEQKAKWLPELVSGKRIAALAMTEPNCGSDLQSIKTHAEKDGNQYKINGSKTFITNGGSADLICLAVKTDPKQGSKGISLLMIETDDLEGFRRGKPLKKVGMKGNDTAELFFDNVKIPQTNLLGPEEGKGFYQLMKQLPWERLYIGIAGLGAADCALEETLKYVKERKAFGKRVFDFQNTKFKLAELKTKTEVTRSFINDCIQKLVAEDLDAATASMAKYWGSQIQGEILDECVQLHGGYGFMAEYPVARMWTDARVQKIYGGTNEIMKELIARSLDD